MHSVLEGFTLRPMCISSTNLANWLKISTRLFLRYLLLSITNAPSSTFTMQNSSKIFPELKDFGLWLRIWSVERGEMLCLDNMDFVSLFLVYSFSNVSASYMTRNNKINGSMLSPCLNYTLRGI